MLGLIMTKDQLNEQIQAFEEAKNKLLEAKKIYNEARRQYVNNRIREMLTDLTGQNSVWDNKMVDAIRCKIADELLGIMLQDEFYPLD